MEDRVVSYAQNREDVLLAAFFPDDYKGFYVDIGAHHPVYDSVTKYFYERGWRGVNIEPNPRLFELLSGDRPEDLNLNIGIGSKPGKLKLRVYDNGDGLSTFSSEMKLHYEEIENGLVKTYHDHEVDISPLSTTLLKNGVKKIDFLKVDVEGFEYEALSGNDWKQFRPKVICIEANHIIKDWRPLLKKEKYEEVFFDGLNAYFVAVEATDCKQHFSYVQGIIGRPILPLKWNQELLHQISLRKRQEIENQTLLARKNESDRQVAFLLAELENQRRFRTLVKALLLKTDAIVRARIEATNKPVRKNTIKRAPLPDSYANGSHNSKQELIKIARASDMASFYTIANNTPKVKKSMVYVILISLYKGLRKVAKFCIVSAFKLLKLIKGRT